MEDNEFNQELAFDLLSAHGISVEVAGNGQEALDLLDERHFDGVLMDCQMPVMDGYTATRRIRQQERFRDLPIIAMTANVLSGDRERTLEVGMNDHIGKPINVRDMFRTLARWVTPSQATTALPGAGRADANQVGLPDFTHIDKDVGLHLTGNDEIAYLRLLRKFAMAQSQTGVELDQAIRAGDTETALRIAHTIKGIAGSIGAIRLGEVAAQLETGLAEAEETKPLPQKLLSAFDSELSLVLDELGSLQAEDPVQGGDFLDAEELRGRLDEILDDLANYDTAAEGRLLALMAAVSDPERLARFRQARSLLERYEFDQAQATLRACEI